MLRQSSPCLVDGHYGKIFSVIQSSRTLREAMTKRGRCSVFRQRPFDVSATTGCCRGSRFLLQENMMQGLVFRKCGEKLKTAEHNLIFGNKTAGHRTPKPGPGWLILVLPRTSGIAAQKYTANSGTLERTTLLGKRHRSWKSCCFPVWSTCLEFAAYFRFEITSGWNLYLVGLWNLA